MNLQTRAGREIWRSELLDLLLRWDSEHGNCFCKESCAPLRNFLEKSNMTIGIRLGRPTVLPETDPRSLDTELSLLCSLVEEIRLDVGSALSGVLEVPKMIGTLLWSEGWGDPLLQSRDEWEWGRSFEHQKASVRMARIGFVRALINKIFSEEALSKLETGLREKSQIIEDINDRTNNEAQLLFEDDEGHPYADLLVEEANAFENFVDWFGQRDVIAPHIPVHIRGRIQAVDSKSFIRTVGHEFRCEAGYSLSEGLNPPELDNRNCPSSYLRANISDFFLSGGRHNGHSFAWGLAVKAGGVFVSLQLFLDPYEDQRDHVLRKEYEVVVSAYNSILAPLMDREGIAPKAGVILSLVRNDALVISSNRDLRRAATREPWNLPKGWRCILDVSDHSFEPSEHEELISQVEDDHETKACIEFVYRVKSSLPEVG